VTSKRDALLGVDKDGYISHSELRFILQQPVRVVLHPDAVMQVPCLSRPTAACVRACEGAGSAWTYTRFMMISTELLHLRSERISRPDIAIFHSLGAGPITAVADTGRSVRR